MKQKDWDSKTAREQAEYLREHEIKIKTQTFLDGSQPVGNAKVTVGRMAVCGGVSLTGWCTDDAETVRAAALKQIELLEAKSA